MVQSLGNVRSDSINFNKDIFGNIFSRKKQVEVRLRGIQRARWRT